MYKYLVFSIVILNFIDLSIAYSSGAPVEVCKSLTPNHGVDAQTTPSPYSIVVNSRNATTNGKVRVTIQGSEKFKGYIIQARDARKHEPVGTFEANSASNLLDCPPGKSNSITHKDAGSPVSSPTFVWRPNGFKGRVYFIGTVAQTGSVFWTNLKSQTFQIA